MGILVSGYNHYNLEKSRFFSLSSRPISTNSELMLQHSFLNPGLMLQHSFLHPELMLQHLFFKSRAYALCSSTFFFNSELLFWCSFFTSRAYAPALFYTSLFFLCSGVLLTSRAFLLWAYTTNLFFLYRA